MLIILLASTAVAFGIPGDPFPGVPTLPIVNPLPDPNNPLIIPLNTLSLQSAPTTTPSSPPIASSGGQNTGTPNTVNNPVANTPGTSSSDSPVVNAPGSGTNNNPTPGGGTATASQNSPSVIITQSSGATPSQPAVNSQASNQFPNAETALASTATAGQTVEPSETSAPNPSQTGDQNQGSTSPTRWIIVAAAALIVLLMLILILRYSRRSPKRNVKSPNSQLSDPPDVPYRSVSPIFAASPEANVDSTSRPRRSSPPASDSRRSPVRTFSFPLPPTASPPSEARRAPVDYETTISNGSATEDLAAMFNLQQRALENQSFISETSTDVRSSYLESQGEINYWEPTPSESISIAPPRKALSPTQSFNWSQNLDENRNKENFASKNLEGATDANEYQPGDYTVAYKRSTLPKHVLNGQPRFNPVKKQSPLRENTSKVQIPEQPRLSPLGNPFR